jgi:Rps23 Pro-64 3,4-dihydroxylase Tpa1-like proline 4-hydroxylase
MTTESFLNKEQLFPGIWVYRDVIKKDLNITERVESFIEKNPQQSWQEATVGYQQKFPEYRDCLDFKIQKNTNPNISPQEIELNNIWQDAYNAQIVAVDDYCRTYNVKMEYWEAMNFIKYGPGQHFQEHADHGFSYIATVSLVAYPNDDYEGGELFFPKLNVTIKPKAGDLYIFPSTYLFSHRAMPVHSGLKYSIVTMLDYNDDTHNMDYQALVQRRLNR